MITISQAHEKDIRIIREIAEVTWQPTYVPIIGQQQVDYMLAKMYSEAELTRQMMEGHQFLLAYAENTPCGFAGYGVSDPEAKLYKLHKLYILPDVHGQGVGRLLIQEVIDRVKKLGATRLELNVNRQNPALAFYKRIGFEIRETVDLDIGNGYFMNDYMMEKAL